MSKKKRHPMAEGDYERITGITMNPFIPYRARAAFKRYVPWLKDKVANMPAEAEPTATAKDQVKSYMGQLETDMRLNGEPGSMIATEWTDR